MPLPEFTSERTVLAKRMVDAERDTAVVVVETVAEVTGGPLDELPPLESVIDSDSLDRIFEKRTVSGYVTFEYLGYLVCVGADGLVAVFESS